MFHHIFILLPFKLTSTESKVYAIEQVMMLKAPLTIEMKF